MSKREKYLNRIRKEVNARFEHQSAFLANKNISNLFEDNQDEWTKLINGDSNVNLSTEDLYYCRLGFIAVYLGKESEIPGFTNTEIYRSLQGRRILSMRGLEDEELPSFIFDDFDQNLFLDSLIFMHKGYPTIKQIEMNYKKQQQDRRNAKQGWYVNDSLAEEKSEPISMLFKRFFNGPLDDITGVVVYPYYSTNEQFNIRVVVLYDNDKLKSELLMPIAGIDDVRFSIGRSKINRYDNITDSMIAEELYNGIILYDRDGQVITRQIETRIKPENDILINNRIRLGNSILNIFRDAIDDRFSDDMIQKGPSM